MYSFSGPAEVRGRFQKLRDILHPVLIGIFLAMPWVKIQGHPVFLFDIWHRHFVFFGFPFFSHDAPLLFFLVILLVLSIFLVTAVFGRLWCGWSCPQTVFIQGVFNRVEKLILGPFAKRQLFEKENDSFIKKFKIIQIYIIFFVISGILSHSLVAYFIGAEAVTSSVVDGPAAHLPLFVVLMIMTFVLFVNFTFFREKLCFYICPYGRFQTALIDRYSLGVFYDTLRGEPRGKKGSQQNGPQQRGQMGSCVDCRRCVTVCPTRIDIREGFQLECISCGKCVDACDEVMQKLNRPLGLIRYETGDLKKITFKRFRILLYSGLIFIFALAFIWTLNSRRPIVINVNRAHPVPFSARIDGNQRILQNQIWIHLKNQSEVTQSVRIELSSNDLAKGYHLISPALQMDLEPFQDLKTTAFLEIEEPEFKRNSNSLVIQMMSEGARIDIPFVFVRGD